MSGDHNERRKAIGDKISKTKKEKYKDKTKLSIYIEKFGADGPRIYGEYLQSIFKSIGSSKEANTFFASMVSEHGWLTEKTLFYRAGGEHKEWFISDTDGICFYDFTVLESKTILEYDGARWHPTANQVELYENELMDITGLSFKQAFDRDIKKKQKAEANGFQVFVVRSDFSDEEKSKVVNEFLNRTQFLCNL